MAAVTDLTWAQVNEALKDLLDTNAEVIGLDEYGNPVTIDIESVINSHSEDAGGKTGVVEFASKFFDACAKAQTLANDGLDLAEQLTAFRPIVAGPLIGTLMSVNRTVSAQHDLSSSSIILGTNN